MDLAEFNSGAGSPATKPWLNPVVNTIECQDATVHGRVTQEGKRPTPYAVWAMTNDFPLVASGISTFSMGTYTGSAEIPATSLYPGASFRIKIGGNIATTVANTVSFSIRNLDGSYVYASTDLVIGPPPKNAPFEAEFNIQITALGGAGVGAMRSVSSSSFSDGAIMDVFSISDSVGFSTTGGVGFYLYMSNSAAGNSITRRLGYCTSVF